jgi:hypothetical protein
MRSFGIRQAWVSVVLAAMALAVAAGAAAGETFCLKCQADRWRTLDAQLLQRAENLKKARIVLRLAQQKGDAALLQQAQAAVNRATKDWEYFDKTAEALNSHTYRAFLARHHVDVDARYDEARARLDRRTKEFDRLRKALGSQKQATLKEMQGILDQTVREHRDAGSDLLFNAVQVVGGHVDVLVKEMQAAHAAAEKIRAMESFARVAKLVHAGHAAADLYKKEYWQAATEGGRLVLAESIPWLLAGAGAGAMMGAATGLPLAVTLALDVATINLSYDEFHAAEERLQGVRNIELAWQAEIESLGARVKTLEAERALAEDAIQRQKAFEQQVRKIQREMNP